MPVDPPQGQDIDEDAAQRAIRRRVTILGVLLLFALIVGTTAGLIIVHRPGFAHHAFNIWALVLPLAVVGTIVAVSVPWTRGQLRRPAYRRLMQYGERRVQRVAKDLNRGRPLSSEDMPVGAALVDLRRRQGKWPLITYVFAMVVSLFSGVINHGFLRWLFFVIAVFFVVALTLAPRDQRRLLRNFERLKNPTVDDHPDDDSS